jgi:hypothetical protein
MREEAEEDVLRYMLEKCKAKEDEMAQCKAAR